MKLDGGARLILEAAAGYERQPPLAVCMEKLAVAAGRDQRAALAPGRRIDHRQLVVGFANEEIIAKRAQQARNLTQRTPDC